jgi:hypothetical protein
MREAHATLRKENHSPILLDTQACSHNTGGDKLMTTPTARRKAVLNKLHEVERMVTVIQDLDEHDPERALAVVRWMVEAEEATTLATEVRELLSAQELAELEVATSAISTEETQRWEKKRREMWIAKLWGDPNR